MAETRKDPKLKEHILTTSLDLMSRKGVAGTTLKQVAESCGISRGTLYYYYKSKDDLILDINKWNMDRLTGTLFGLLDSYMKEGREPSQIVLEVFRAVGGAEMRGRMHLYLINEAISRNPDLTERLRESYRNWFQILEEAFTKILPENADRQAVARGLVAALDGMVIQNILSLDDIPLERIVSVEINGYGG